MSRKATESASPDALVQHVIQYFATGPDGTETAGLATVTGTAHTIPWSQLARIPGFLEADVLSEHDDDPRPLLLGPGTDAPGHAAWCDTHNDEMGDGTSVCHGATLEVADEDESAGTLTASLVASTGEAPRMFLEHSTENSVSLESAREYAHVLLSLIAQAEAGTAVAR